MLELTSTEIQQLDDDTKLYEGVGKMCVVVLINITSDRNDYSYKYAECECRFVFSPSKDVQKRLSSNVAEIKSDIGSLNKKLHYLETTHKNSREHIEKIIGSSGGKS